MQPETLFLILNYGVLLPWSLFVLAPGWRPTRWLIRTTVLPAALGLLYVLVMLLAPIPTGGGDLPAVTRVLGSPWGATVMWIHALAFDLFVGAWILRDARRRGVPHLLAAPCLLLTLFFGPAGAVAYLGLRAIRHYRGDLEEQDESS